MFYPALGCFVASAVTARCVVLNMKSNAVSVHLFSLIINKCISLYARPVGSLKMKM